MATETTLVRSDWNATIWIEGAGHAERRLEVTPAIAGWNLLSFRSYTFRAGQVIDGESAADEMTMILLTGAVTIEIDGPTGQHRWECDGRASVFAGPPFALYLPPHHFYKTTIHRDADCAYGRAPATGVLSPRLVHPGELSTTPDAAGNRLTTIFAPGDTEHLLCHETVIAPGAWAFPSDGDEHGEAVSYYRAEPETGWGMQRVDDQALLVRHGDAAIVRGGVQPVAASPGTRLYVLTYKAGATS